MSEKLLSTSLLEFSERLRKWASEVNLDVKDQPDLTGHFFRGGTTASTTLDPSDLPTESIAYRVGRYTIMVGMLPDVPTPEAIIETLRRYRNQCVVARSYLSSSQSLDLQLMLLGPRGSEGLDTWRSLALMVERDDRVARKLAWLRPEDSQRDSQSFAEFVKRTFLARPWEKAIKFENISLDQLSEPAVIGGSLPRSTAEEWELIALALDSDSSHDETVDALIKSWQKRSNT